METLLKFWDVAEREAQKGSSTFDSVFGDIGLYLQRPLSNLGYNSTPINTSTFATTGGDGVHYGLLHLNGEVRDNSPIVMTIPMMFEKGNLIVGGNLSDFLCLGCQVGYFDLEQMVYDEKEAVRNIGHPQTWAEEIKTWIDENEAYGFDAAARSIGRFVEIVRQRRELLDVLTSEFSLKPWPQVQARLDELNTTYLPTLKLPLDTE
jgi:hypothetical protein